MTIHFFPKGDRQTASSRQRAYNVAAELSKTGVSTIVYEPFSKLFIHSTLLGKVRGVIKIFRCLSQVKKGDIIFIQRAVYNSYFLFLLIPFKVVFRRKLIFDLDDSIFLHMPFRTKLIAQMADIVIVGSHFLKNWAVKYNKRVYFIPTAIDFSTYNKYSVDYKTRNPVIIGWIGHGPAHFENLKILVPVLEECIKRKYVLKLIIVGSLESKKVKSLFDNIDGINIEYIDSLEWSAFDVVPRAIQKFDIGVMPLADSSWNKGKCSFKAIEYMACGVPVVISDVGENTYLINDGKNGFSAGNTAEWVNKLEQLIFNKNLREELGKKGQDTIRHGYSYDITIPKLRSLLN